MINNLLNKSSILVIGAHQDDLALACSSIIQAKPWAIHAVIATDGAPKVSDRYTSEKYSVFGKTKEEYEATRNQEEINAMNVLELDKSKIHFLRQKNDELYQSINSLVSALKKSISIIAPEVVFVHDYEQGHPDHDIVIFSTIEAISQLNINPEIYTFPLYHVDDDKDIWFKFNEASRGNFLGKEYILTLTEKEGNVVHIEVSARKFLLPKPAIAGGVVYEVTERLK